MDLSEIQCSFSLKRTCLCNFMLCLLLLVQFATSHSGSSVRARAHERPCFDFRRATTPLVPKHSHHCSLYYFVLHRHLFQIPSKLLNSTTLQVRQNLGCDCAFHSGREHQDLLPPDGWQTESQWQGGPPSRCNNNT